jgi:hypothetical protein
MDYDAGMFFYGSVRRSLSGTMIITNLRLPGRALFLEASGLGNVYVFTFAVSPKESFGHNSGCFAGGSITSAKCAGLPSRSGGLNMTDR